MKYEYNYCGATRWDWMMALAETIQRINYAFPETHPNVRPWHVREQRRYNMHPVIQKAVLLAPPADWHQLVLEWPHVSISSDTSKIAYTRNEQHGIDDRQTATSVGKYITRHFPTLKDHEVRDICGMYGASVFKITHDMEEMIDYIQRGPRSCMVFSENDGDGMDDEHHPYRVYAPALGWGLAVRLAGNSVDGRALVNENSKVFVRSYSRNDGGYSGSDEALNSWLNDQGYTHRGGWPLGTRLKYIPTQGRYGATVPTAPYIDGQNREVDLDAYAGVLSITDEGEYICDNTNGEATEHNACTCPDCNDRVDEDDLVSTYEGHGDSVCNNCIDNSYYYAYGRRGYQYYVHENDMTCVDDTYYHTDFLQDNNIVELHDGEYAALDDAICVHGDWYHVDDDNIVRCEDTDEYEFIEDAWQCYVTDNWYIDDQPIRLCDIDTQDELTVHEDEIQTYEADIECIDVTTLIEGV